MSPRTPLAWKNLTTDWRKLVLACAGVAFAVVLMFMENGFRYALLDSPVQFVEMLDCDLIATSRTRYALPAEQTFPQRLMDRASGDRDVAATTSLPIETATAQIRVVGLPQRPIRVIGMPVDTGWIAAPQLARSLPLLRQPRAGLLDRMTRPEYGFATGRIDRLAQQPVELVGREVRIVGTVDIGTDFANEGTLLIDRDQFAKYFYFRGGGDPLAVVDLGLIQLQPGTSPALVAERLTELAPGTWQVMTKAELIRREVEFWSNQTPVGMIFLIGAMMGFAVGVIICYQILFTSIQDSLPEFATLKAIGYPNGYFLWLVVRQSIYLSLLGFLPGLAISLALFKLLETAAGLPMLITLPRAGLVLGLTAMMCLCSGLLALRKLLRADPASLF